MDCRSTGMKQMWVFKDACYCLGCLNKAIINYCSPHGGAEEDPAFMVAYHHHPNLNEGSDYNARPERFWCVDCKNPVPIKVWRVGGRVHCFGCVMMLLAYYNRPSTRDTLDVLTMEYKPQDD